MTDPGMRLHREVDPANRCGGQVADGDLFGTDYWCVYCGTKWSDAPSISSDPGTYPLDSSPSAGSQRYIDTGERVIPFGSRVARDAQAAGYGDLAYWLHLEQSAFELRGRYLAEKQWELAEQMLQRSLSAALRGNNGD